MNAPVGVVGIGTAVPKYELLQADARRFAAGFFESDLRGLDRLLPIFDNTTIAKRHLVRPIEWFGEPHSFETRNAVYIESALALAEAAARRAIADSGVAPDELGAIVFVSTTGIATPSLDARLVQTLNLRRSISRVPIWGLGCAGGASGLSVATEIARAKSQPVLLIAVEVCSSTFVYEDRTKSNLVATALFGDGAAAVVVGVEPRLPVLQGYSHLIDDSEHVMSWTLRDTGLNVRFSTSIPRLVNDLAPTLVEEARAAASMRTKTFAHWVLHPGGAKVLEAYRRSLSLDEVALAPSQYTLQHYGNMSSPTVLFVLERFMRDVPKAGAPGLLLALGPGFCAEGLVFSW